MVKLDIYNHLKVKEFITSNNISVIINCAAYTAVDKAEEQFEIADKRNHLAVSNFAQLAKEKNVSLIHISTEYVFDGTAHNSYNETDTPSPKSVYGKKKLERDVTIQRKNLENSIIIRTSWVQVLKIIL